MIKKTLISVLTGIFILAMTGLSFAKCGDKGCCDSEKGCDTKTCQSCCTSCCDK